ncbi:MAG TPA: 5'-deoxynucleotidase [Clostridia bacterium]|nr:5'-deoxynucleotidase [Clostridia bacterium]
MKKHHFFAFISRMKYINRWGLMRNTFHENIQEHSLQVAIVAHALATTRNQVFCGNVDADRAAVLAMYHDCNETITGDMPTPVKYYNPEINEAYKKVEHLSKNKLVSMLPNELKDTYSKILFAQEGDKELWRLVKAADRISAYIKCLEEENAGNSEFKKAGEAILKTVEALDMPEVKYFLENFIPSFKLSLDELD